MQKLFLPLLVLVGIILGIGAFIIKPMPKADQPQAEISHKETPMPKMQFIKAEQVIKSDKNYTAILHTTIGNIEIKLSNATPLTTNNFVFLAQKRFYDGVIFHRVIKDFMIQSGDPTGSGSGGPGYRFDDEDFGGEYKRGTVAMANAGPDTNGSQFFIMHADYQLPKNYVIFGQVSTGLEFVDKIATAKTGANDRPLEPVTINSVTIKEE